MQHRGRLQLSGVLIATGGRMRESGLSFEQGCSAMDVEHINAIGNRLADLSQRTVDLRGYL